VLQYFVDIRGEGDVNIIKNPLLGISFFGTPLQCARLSKNATPDDADVTDAWH
jgi:hypothetical protein